MPIGGQIQLALADHMPGIELPPFKAAFYFDAYQMALICGCVCVLALTAGMRFMDRK